MKLNSVNQGCKFNCGFYLTVYAATHWNQNEAIRRKGNTKVWTDSQFDVGKASYYLCL